MTFLIQNSKIENFTLKTCLSKGDNDHCSLDVDEWVSLFQVTEEYGILEPEMGNIYPYCPIFCIPQSTHLILFHRTNGYISMPNDILPMIFIEFKTRMQFIIDTTVELLILSGWFTE